jgi:putative transcriptional regulator
MGRQHPKLLNNLEIVRRRSDLTQAQLSQAAGVSRKSINAIENGLYVPSTVLSLKIARALECEVEDLFRLP